ncbi:unnamed protein product [Moneuplotes crassus]|uniref:Vacuolar protein 14 C-terminal Fig4-binding domain-containing protein n=2 Tax=Euplotes crassus TaxID=5936 RepID=A0AAD1YBL0_EUPCR|nr:unnamed protein product [Moneuplotes crassus]
MDSISEALIKNLGDKSLEKRKQASIELTEKVYSLNSEREIYNLIKYFTFHVDDDTAQKRRIGLYGISSIAVGLYKEDPLTDFCNCLVQPVLVALGDREPKVQLAACDTMFNILKIYREKVLFDLEFPETFDKIVSVVSNPNNDVKDWGRKLVEFLEEIVYGALIKNEDFDIESLMNKAYSKLSKSQNQDILQVLIKWINTFSSLSDYDVIKSLPKFIEKLFIILGTNTKHDIYTMSVNQLKLFLCDYEHCLCRCIRLDIEVLKRLLHFLRDKRNKTIDKSVIFALSWLKNFLKYFKEDLEQKRINTTLQDLMSSYGTEEEKICAMQEIYHGPIRKITSDLNSRRHESLEEQNRKREDLRNTNEELLTVIFPDMLGCVFDYIFVEEELIYLEIKEINRSLEKLVILVARENYDLNTLKMILSSSLEKDEPKTKNLVIGWYITLFKHFPTCLFQIEDDPSFMIIENLNFNDPRYIDRVLYLFSLKSLESSEFLSSIIGLLLRKFRKKKKSNIKESQINTAINIMCKYIDPKIIFSKFAQELMRFNDAHFIGNMTEILEHSLASVNKYKYLRDILKRDHSDEEKKEFFETLFETFCIKNFSTTKLKNPISCITLCILAKKYKLAYYLLICISKNTRFEHCMQVCNFVQQLEGASFMHIRMDLLHFEKNYYLIKTLQMMLMILPTDSKAHINLKTRLECIHIDPMVKAKKRQYYRQIKKGNKDPFPRTNKEESQEVEKYVEMLHVIIQKFLT